MTVTGVELGRRHSFVYRRRGKRYRRRISRQATSLRVALQQRVARRRAVPHHGRLVDERGRVCGRVAGKRAEVRMRLSVFRFESVACLRFLQ